MENTTKPFTDFSFHETLQSALTNMNFENCTPIQAEAMPHILSGKDVSGLAQTGTGKTAAFLLPMIERILRSTVDLPTPTDDDESAESQAAGEFPDRVFDKWQKNNFVLVLVPTRELAEQVKDCAKDFIKDTDQRCVVVYGGVSIERQIEELEKGVTFLVATPGRLIDLFKNHKVDLKQCRAIIFDEADRMFDMGFKDDMKYILRRIPETRQLLLFSATLNLDVFNVAYQFGSTPVELNVSIDQATAENVDDFIFHLGTHEKPAHLLGLMKKKDPKQVIIFTNYKNNVDRVSEFLNRNGYNSAGISSLLNQSQRKRVIEQFRGEGGTNILVATDVAARGLDIKGVDLVINYELPDDAENYVHRIGRTGRAGEKGHAYSFVSDKDVEALERIVRYLGEKIETEWMETEDIPTEFESFPQRDLYANKKRSRPPASGGSRGRGQSRGSGDRKGSGKRDDRPRRKTKASGTSEGSTDSRRSDEDPRKKRVHRDKARGRHKNDRHRDENDKNKPRSVRQPKVAADGSGSQSKKKKSGGQRKRRHYNRKKTTPPPSLLSKVGSAIKGLFGSK